MVKSVSYNQTEILRLIIKLHTGPIEVDVTFGNGGFYKHISHPKFCFDINPKFRFVVKATTEALPIRTMSVHNVVFDPPFLIKTGRGPVLKDRFGQITGGMEDLWGFYKRSLVELYRILKPGGWLVFKNQDGVLSGKNWFTHVEIYNIALAIGFIPIDLFILATYNRFPLLETQTQRHARKYHSYFWVFKKGESR